MIIDLVDEACITGRVRRRHVIETQRRPIGHHQALPCDQGPALPVGYDTIIVADQARSLRYEQHLSGRAVKHALRT